VTSLYSRFKSTRPTHPQKPPWSAVIFLAALGLRFLYLYESSDQPTFHTPIVDAETYNLQAIQVATGLGLSREHFWQPIFYPLYLAGVYFCTGTSLWAPKILQAIVGAGTCVLTYRLGRDTINSEVGVLAGLITVLCGPLIFFDGELLATSWACFWAMLLLQQLCRTPSLWTPAGFFTLGIVGALSVLTRPTFLPFLLAACVWLLHTQRKALSTHATPLIAAILIGGFSSVALPIAGLNHSVTGDFSILPSSGALNFYLGNNPNHKQTVAIRPGWAWDELTRSPGYEGVTSHAQTQFYWQDKAAVYIQNEPFAFFQGLVEKLGQFVSSRELPRNVDIYTYRAWSWVLSQTVWKLGPVGFPFGILLPLALLGLVCGWRRVAMPIKLFIVLYPLAVVMVFVTARYRVPTMPVWCLLAALGLGQLKAWFQRRHFSALALSLVSLVALAFAFSVPGPFAQEGNHYRAEMARLLAARAHQEGRSAQALAWIQKSLADAADTSDSQNVLGLILEDAGQIDEAIDAYRQSLVITPDHVTARINLARLLDGKGQSDAAIEHLYAALKHDYKPIRLYKILALALIHVGRYDEAVGHYRHVLRLNPKDVEVLNNVASALLQSGKADEAIAHYEAALMAEPLFLPALENLARTLVERGQGQKAKALCVTAFRRAHAVGDQKVKKRMRALLHQWDLGTESF
jgi:tetratricopeptide (TPR) repeat protein